MNRSLSRPLAAVAATMLCLAGLPAGAGVDDLYKWIGPAGAPSFSDTPANAGEAPSNETRLRADAAVKRANEQVDLAERELALARHSVWAKAPTRGLDAPRMTQAERERIELYKKNSLAARQALLEILQRTRGAGPTLAATQETTITR